MHEVGHGRSRVRPQPGAEREDVAHRDVELGFAQEAFAESSVVGQFGREQLERRASLQAGLLGQVIPPRPISLSIG